MKLMDYLPPYYQHSPEMVDLQQAIQPELIRMDAEEQSAMAQLDPNTATWGLEVWERALAIPIQRVKPLEARRAKVVGKLRSQGTTTRQMIENVAESFTGSPVEVTEDPPAFRFGLSITGGWEDDAGWEDLRAAIDEIKPAHLTYWLDLLYHLAVCTRERVRLAYLRIASQVGNWGQAQPICFDGERRFDSTICFDQQVARHGMLWLTVRAGSQTVEQFRTGWEMAAMSHNRQAGTAALAAKGAATNENSNSLEVQNTSRVHGAFGQGASWGFSGLARQHKGVATGSTAKSQVQNSQTGWAAVEAQASFNQPYNSAACLTVNQGFCFDGEKTFGSGKKFNANTQHIL